MIKVAFIIDESGSMRWMRDKIVSLINEQMDTLEKQDAEIYFYKFSDTAKKIRNENSKKLTRFTEDDYSPDGNTALYDAVKMAVEEMSEGDRYDDKYLTLVISDGMENASKVNRTEISGLIKEKIATDRWTFTYLGGSQDLATSAVDQFHMSVNNSAVFNPYKMKESSKLMTRGLDTYFAASVGSVSNFYGE